MKKQRFAAIVLAVTLGTAPLTGSAKENHVCPSMDNLDQVVPMCRLYNPNSGEHFYTSSEAEQNHLVSVGWKDEQYGWLCADAKRTPVYRLYNPNAGDHHYTTDAKERKALIQIGWNDEGIGWYATNKNDGVPIYRQYNPNAKTGSHNFTGDVEEVKHLVKAGWKDEGIAFYAPSLTKAKEKHQKVTTDVKNDLMVHKSSIYQGSSDCRDKLASQKEAIQNALSSIDSQAKNLTDQKTTDSSTLAQKTQDNNHTKQNKTNAQQKKYDLERDPILQIGNVTELLEQKRQALSRTEQRQTDLAIAVEQAKTNYNPYQEQYEMQMAGFFYHVTHDIAYLRPYQSTEKGAALYDKNNELMQYTHFGEESDATSLSNLRLSLEMLKDGALMQ